MGKRCDLRSQGKNQALPAIPSHEQTYRKCPFGTTQPRGKWLGIPLRLKGWKLDHRSQNLPEDWKKAGLPKNIVLYSGRHTFGTRLLANTGNLSLVMRAMGHSSPQTAMIYQHPDLEVIRTVMDVGTIQNRSRHN